MLLLSLCSLTAKEPDRKKVSNKIYSFSVPSNWKQSYPEDGDGIPGERDAHIPTGGNTVAFHLYALAMKSPYKNATEFFDGIGLSIQSYERKDGGDLSIDEIKNIETSGLKPPEVTVLEEREIAADATQKRFVLTEISDEASVTTGTRKVKHCRFYLLYKGGKTVHCMEIFLRESRLNPESQAVINDILDSFVAK
jgi:hypothetical protein